MLLCRAPSSESSASVESSSGQKRRLSLSEVLSSQKKMRPSQQAVRHSFGGVAAGAHVLPAAAASRRQFAAAAAVDMKAGPSSGASNEDENETVVSSSTQYNEYNNIVPYRTLFINNGGVDCIHIFLHILHSCSTCLSDISHDFPVLITRLREHSLSS